MMVEPINQNNFETNNLYVEAWKAEVLHGRLYNQKNHDGALIGLTLMDGTEDTQDVRANL